MATPPISNSFELADTSGLLQLLDEAASIAGESISTDTEELNKQILTHRSILSRLQENARCLCIPRNGGSKSKGQRTEYGVEGIDFEYGNVDELDPQEWQVPEFCVPIHADVRTYDWSTLYNYTQFDVIMMDPPWQLASANPTRGVALGYSQLSDKQIGELPIPKLQANGLLFVWVINAKYQLCLNLFEKWGYRLVDEIVWVKMTVNRRLAKSHGFYLQHAKEVCLVGQRGADPAGFKPNTGSDVIFSERRGQSQKPEEIYELIECMVPNGKYLEIFARKNNLRNWWVSVGNEVTGTGPPQRNTNV